ncbi:MAG: hypothetical protein HN742_14455 [Lentisphaerae bacterium]|jgi:hypothetical protein|nr:hypothetical protein [Lentisphaerota bacterium]MBT5606846.1 hypothetical protein [Lentisphaerota bacterium]MBT7055296.1 hypothetical protein [Lentisphaerota bacterium]MBT7843077.1 hypothetical protein [Lentisphaerota bacterium]
MFQGSRVTCSLSLCVVLALAWGCISWHPGFADGVAFSAGVLNGQLTTSSPAQITTNGGPAVAQQDGLHSNAYDRIEVRKLRRLRGIQTLTLAAWVAPSKTPRSYETVLFKGERGATPPQIHFSLCLFDGIPEIKYMDAAGKWCGIMRNAGNLQCPGAAPVPLGQLPRVKARRWHHVAATFSAGKAAVYLDGMPMASGTGEMAELVPNSAPLVIGAGQAAGGGRAYLFPGLINDVLVLNHALAADEVQALYDEQRAGKPDGMIDIPRPAIEIAVEHAFETELPLVTDYVAKSPGVPLDTSKGVTVDRVADSMVLRIGDQPIYPVAMMPEPYVKDADITLSCRDFAAAGVDIYSEIFWSWMSPRDGAHSWWLGVGKYDFARIDARVKAVLDANPKALLLPRLKLNPPKWWLKAHPDHIVKYADGTPGPQVSLASREWTTLYSRMLRDIIGHMEASDYANRIFGYHPAGGGSSEWFWWGHNRGTIDSSPVAVARWREWLGERYRTDQALAAAWGNSEARLDAAMPPPPEARDHGKEVFLRLIPSERPWADYREFLSDTTAENIIESCRVAREACGGRKIAGVFYGYSMYCNNTLGFRGLRRVMVSPHVNFLCAPTSYSRRRGGQPGSHISAYNGSMRLHGKLYWDEADNRTHLFPGVVGYRTDTMQETLATLRRVVGHSLTRGTGLWYFLLAGNTTFHDQEIMTDIAAMKRICDEALTHNRAPAAEVAVFADEASMHLYDTGHPIAKHLGLRLLDELAQAGAPFDLYQLDDIANPELPDYRVYVFPNAFRKDEALHQAITRKVRRNGATVLWVYAPGFVGTDGGDIQRMQALTGLRIEVLADGVAPCALNGSEAHPVTSALSTPLQVSFPLVPAFSVIDDDATVLAHTDTCAGLAVREFPQWRSVYSLVPPDRELLLGLYRYAGVHIYCDTFDTIGASPDYLMIHTATAGRKKLRLPRACNVTELVTGRRVGKSVRTIREKLPKGVTRIYRLR